MSCFDNNREPKPNYDLFYLLIQHECYNAYKNTTNYKNLTERSVCKNEY